MVPQLPGSPHTGHSSQSEGRGYSTAEEEREEEARSAKKRRRSERKEEEERGIPAMVPLNIVDIMLPFFTLEQVSERVCGILTTAFLLACGVDPDKVGLSRWAIHAKKVRFLETIGGDVLDKFATDVKAANTPLTLHWDSKLVCQDFEGRKELLHRLVVYLSSPWLDRGQLLTAAPMERETGAGVAEELFTLVEGLDLTSNLVAVCTDTPSVNTGQERGAIVEFFRRLDRPLIMIHCGHHMVELVAKAVAAAVSGRPSEGPEDKLIALIYKNQNTIIDAIPSVNYTFEKFDWDANSAAAATNRAAADTAAAAGDMAVASTATATAVACTALGVAARQVVEWGRRALEEEAYSRGDYRNLLKLTLIYLGEEVENFKIPRPCKVKKIFNYFLLIC